MTLLNKKISGFTLVELLVVIAVIALMMSVILAVWSGLKAKSRDTKRAADVKAIQDALALYNTTVQRFPISADVLVLPGADAVSLELISSGSIPAVPTDPLRNPPYQYSYQTDADGSTFIVTYYLETDSISGKSAGENTVTP